ncbi:Transposon Ty3-G Gag-Pol polyprotein [Labeo rohita]|uniref:ribonuclease H n=1 Tax=Labeo rohita TaxID=84645 RepID=A0ABQ8L1P2_LABRO|nr:Transposon Ty3-G Gag-Pol polyprotein [Labeo rohita]
MQRLCVRSGSIHLSRRWIYGTDSGLSLSDTARVEAAAMCVEEERQVLSDALPGTSPQTVHPVCPPMESLDESESLSQYGLDLLFGAPAEEKAGSVASEGEPSEVDVTAELAAPAVESQSVADAEMAAALKRAAKEIGVVWVPPPSPEPSRLDDWFLGSGRDSRPRSSPVPFFPEVHEELTKSWKAPLLARSRHAIYPSLTTLDGGPARGYTEVPQVERAIAHKTPPPGGAAQDSRPGLRRLMRPLGKLRPPYMLWRFCRSISLRFSKTCTRVFLTQSSYTSCALATDYALRATKVTAQALGRAMSTMVVQERHLWLNLAEMRDAEKARFLDAPISQAGLFCETVEEFAQQFSTVKQQTEAIKRILPSSADAATSACPPPRETPYEDPPNGPALVGRWHRQPVLRPLRTLVRLQSVPETGSPGKEDLLITRRGDERWIRLLPGCLPPGRRPPHASVPPYALRHRAHSDDLPSRADHLHSSHGTNSLGRTASVVRGFSPSATHCFPSDGTPTLGTPNVTPLRPLAENFSDWLNLPNPSRWLLRTIRLGYAIQFARRLPKFRGVLTTSVQGPNTAVLRVEIAVLLAKGAIETVPSAEMKKGFYSPYFIVPKKGGRLRPILDLRVLNRALLKLPFKMLTLKHILTCVRIQDWFVGIDLKDAYFHVSILPRHRPFLRFAFEGRAYQYKVLPFGLSLSPRVFTKGHGSQPFGSVGTSGQLGNKQTLPGTENLFSLRRAGLGQYVCVSLPGACTVSSEVCGNTQMRVSGPPKTGSEAPRAHGILSRGHAAGFDAHETAATLASYSSPQVGVASRHISSEHHTIVSPDTEPLDRHCVPTVRSSPGTGVQTHHCHHRCFRDRLGCHLQWAGSFRGLDRPPTVLAHKLSGVVGSAPSPEEVPTYDSGQAHVGQVSLGGEWRLHPQSVQLIWDRFGQAQLDLFASPESTHCQLWYGLTEAPLGIDALAHSWQRGRLKYAFPPVSLIAQTLCKVREDEEQILLVAPFWPNRTWFSDLVLLASAPPCAHFHQKSGRPPSPHREQFVPGIRTSGFSRCLETPAWICAQGPHHSLQRSVRALYIYMERTQPFRRSEQLFVCYGGQQKGKAVTKQRISHWLVNAIRMAYLARGLPCPLESLHKALPLMVITLLSFSRFPDANPGHHLHLWHFCTWRSLAEKLAMESHHKDLSLAVSPGVRPTSGPMSNYVTLTPPVGQVVNSVMSFPSGTGIFSQRSQDTQLPFEEGPAAGPCCTGNGDVVSPIPHLWSASERAEMLGSSESERRCLGSQERPLVSYTTRHNVSVPSIRERGLPYVTEMFYLLDELV